MQITSSLSRLFTWYFPWGISLLLTLFCCWLIFLHVDQAVTLDHQTSSNFLLQGQRDLLRRIAETYMKDIARKQFLEFLHKQKMQYFEKGEGSIIVEDIVFCFEDDKLITIEANN